MVWPNTLQHMHSASSTTAHLVLAFRQDGALGAGAAQRIKQRHECLVLGLLVKLEVDHRLCELQAQHEHGETGTSHSMGCPSCYTSCRNGSTNQQP
jgi:hypothetical protein